MSRLFVITLGFEEKFAVRMITRHGLDAGDHLLLVTGPRTRQSERAARFLQGFVAQYYGGDVGLEVVEVDPSKGFEQLVKDVYEAVASRAAGRKLVVFNLSGGMRALCLAALEAATLLSTAGLNVKVELETEDSQHLLEIPQPHLKMHQALAQLTPEKEKILREIAEKPLTAKQLAEKLGKDELSLIHI